MIDQSIIQFLVYPEIREEVRPHLKEWMIESDMPKAFLKVILNDKYKGIKPDIRIFALDLNNLPAKYAVSESEITDACKIIKGAKVIEDDNERKQIRKTLTNFIKDKKVAKSINDIVVNRSEDGGSEDQEKYNNLIEAVSFDLTSEEFEEILTLEDVKKAQLEDMPDGGKIIKSYYSIINANSAYGGYKYGDVVMFCAETGVGKTTAMLCEGAYAIDQGFKVAHIFLGDMTKFDAIVMYTSHWKGVLRDKVYSSYEDYVTPDILQKLKNIRIKNIPSDSITIYELRAKLATLYRDFKYDMLIIDYDSNLKDVGENMYLEGGGTYGQVSAEAKGKCTVLIASQSKIEFWGTELLPKRAPADSSRKQNHLDIEVCIGRSPECSVVGTLNLTKMRRGKSDVITRIHLDNAHTRVPEISQDRYDGIKRAHVTAALEKDTIVSFGDED